jgi:hypothetical protein
MFYNLLVKYNKIMGKVGKKLPEEYKLKAIENGISIQTVYGRLQRGWDLEKAVTKKSTKIPLLTRKNSRTETGEYKASKRPKGRNIGVTIYKDLEPLLNQAIEESGKTKSEFIGDIVEEYLLKSWQPKAKKKNHRTRKTK